MYMREANPPRGEKPIKRVAEFGQLMNCAVGAFRVKSHFEEDPQDGGFKPMAQTRPTASSLSSPQALRSRIFSWRTGLSFSLRPEVKQAKELRL